MADPAPARRVQRLWNPRRPVTGVGRTPRSIHPVIVGTMSSIAGVELMMMTMMRDGRMLQQRHYDAVVVVADDVLSSLMLVSIMIVPA